MAALDKEVKAFVLIIQLFVFSENNIITFNLTDVFIYISLVMQYAIAFPTQSNCDRNNCNSPIQHICVNVNGVQFTFPNMCSLELLNCVIHQSTYLKKKTNYQIRNDFNIILLTDYTLLHRGSCRYWVFWIWQWTSKFRRCSWKKQKSSLNHVSQDCGIFECIYV